MSVAGPLRDEFGQLQESDFLDQLGDRDPGENRASADTDHIMLISLGAYCGPKLTFQKIGRGAETLPFDWCRTRIEGLLHYLRNSFEGFFDFTTRKPVPDAKMIMFRDWYHSFWHDDPTDKGMIERYKRRIDRFDHIGDHSRPLLFVRVAATTDELHKVLELLNELLARFGPALGLLVILNFQKTASGAAFVEGVPNLLLYFLEGGVHARPGGVPYRKPVICGLDWMARKEFDAMRFPTLDHVLDCVDPTHWGFTGLGGLRAFEDGQLDLELVERGGAIVGRIELERHSPKAPAPKIDDHIICISLGCAPETKLALQKMHRGSLSLPFDWVRTSHRGITHFVNNDFQDFLSHSTDLLVPGCHENVFRSKYHSFWHDDPKEHLVQKDYAERIDHLRALQKDTQPLLFIREVASTTEVIFAHEILDAITLRFGGRACLLLIVNCQRTSLGPHVVEGLDDLLAYFVEVSSASDAGPGDLGAPISYEVAINCAVRWMKGDALEAVCVDDLQKLAELADETHRGLWGPGGLSIVDHVDLQNPSCDSQQAQSLDIRMTTQVVSLGFHPGAKLSIQKVVFKELSEVEHFPFDWIRSRLDGVLHFVQRGFDDFFDAAKVPGLDGSELYRSFWHSFAQDPNEPDNRAWLERSIAAFHRLRRKHLAQEQAEALLFVRVAAEAQELMRAGELLGELTAHFGRSCSLLMVLDFQSKMRLCTVDGYNHLLVYFQGVEAHEKMDGAPYCDAITAALEWFSGSRLQVCTCSSFEALTSIATPTDWGLHGPNGHRAFQDTPPASLRESIVS